MDDIGKLTRGWRCVVLREDVSGNVAVEVLDRVTVTLDTGEVMDKDIGGFPSPFDPAEIINVPGFGPIPAQAIIGAVTVWVNAKRDAHLNPVQAVPVDDAKE